ncbi:MAG: hypothetical protein J1F37_03565 [Oscillospiraceae bacterium]|nr:hypothetical protein [Oscillospiraceae bacterium]
MSEEKREFSESADNIVPTGMEYNVFDCNTNSNTDTRNMNREYLKRIYKEDMDFLNKDVRMTRSDYISEYNKIEEYYKQTQKECLKDFLAVFAIAAFCSLLYYFLTYLHNNISSFVITNILTMAVIACKLASIIICVSLVLAVAKKLAKAGKTKQKSLDLLERKKQELMLLGLYDLSN